MRPSGVELDLHLAIGLHEVRRETLYISLTNVRGIEYPLAAHLVLDVEVFQQFVEAHGGESVVLRYLRDGDRLRAAQDVACIVRQRFLLRTDFLEQGVSVFQLAGTLLQLVVPVLTDGRKDFAGDPTLEAACAIELA